LTTRVESDDARIRNVLMQYPCYRDGDEKLREDLAAACQYMEPPKGTQLMEAGRDCDVIVFVGRGSVRVYIVGDSGREVTLYHVNAGEACPVNLCAAMLSMESFANATTSRNVQMLAIPAKSLREIVQRHPALRDYIFKATVTRYGEVIHLVREIVTRRVDHRLVEFLLRNFEDSDKIPPVIELTHEDIALDLGTAREVVSRRLQELEKQGGVELGRGRIILADEAVLRLGLFGG